ncbi:hypothetical protein SBA4_4880004 [Candidatus Sulfopaludibacter sp. SbA4]|nr:hypothetical protein SBA4_4880004 [Candidatus Sulfopaludibacter sp. SbA4]
MEQPAVVTHVTHKMGCAGLLFWVVLSCFVSFGCEEMPSFCDASGGVFLQDASQTGRGMERVRRWRVSARGFLREKVWWEG